MWIIAGIAALVVLLAGLATAFWYVNRDTPEGALDTDLSGVTVTTATTPPPPPPPKPKPVADKLCWPYFGGDPQRTLARPDVTLGIPVRRHRWTRALDSYIEYPPSYCDGVLYVNSYRGTTYALDSETGKVLWHRSKGGTKPSTPAIDGPRLLVSSLDGTVTALDRETGKDLWQVQTAGDVESSPVVIDGIAYFGATDGRLFAVSSRTGRIRWAYDTGAKITASPSVWGHRVCISNYAGAIRCLDRISGRELWTTYFKRDAFRWESFYASPSTDGERVYCVARSGRVVALNARDGSTAWTASVGGLGYTTPSIADGRVFVGGFDGRLRAFRASSGTELWTTYVGGKILGAPFVAGNHVFFSTLDKRTFAVRATDGEVVWRISMGRYSPGITTERTYYLSLNGRVIAIRGRTAPPA
jgi:outer membrane protein assembly factor BamB